MRHPYALGRGVWRSKLAFHVAGHLDIAVSLTKPSEIKTENDPFWIKAAMQSHPEDDGMDVDSRGLPTCWHSFIFICLVPLSDTTNMSLTLLTRNLSSSSIISVEKAFINKPSLGWRKLGDQKQSRLPR
jgi:hypothetical protein